MQEWNKRNSLYVQLLILLILAAAAAGVLFYGLNYAGEYAVEKYYTDTDYTAKQDDKYIWKLQEYVDANQLSLTDTKELKRWVNKQKIISLQIYQNDILYFDSENTSSDALWESNIEATYYDWNEYYTVNFSEGEAVAGIYGNYDYRMFNLAFVLELLIAFLFFLCLGILGIRSKIHYVIQLKKEVELLQSGNLDYVITVKGRDELSYLAEGLDHMRESFRQQVETEAKMVQENQRIITEMSHDLRTPITAIILYTTILKKDVSQKAEKRWEYLDKIERKAEQMKQLTDHLFEYSLITGESEVELEPPQKLKSLFYDLFSETSQYLETKGHKVQLEVVWRDNSIQINSDYLMRIMDNITSNILKYAAAECPVILRDVEKENLTGFQFENTISAESGNTESTGIGVNSIRNMMSKMGGICETEQDGTTYRISILFCREDFFL